MLNINNESHNPYYIIENSMYFTKHYIEYLNLILYGSLQPNEQQYINNILKLDDSNPLKTEFLMERFKDFNSLKFIQSLESHIPNNIKLITNKYKSIYNKADYYTVCKIPYFYSVSSLEHPIPILIGNGEEVTKINRIEIVALQENKLYNALYECTISADFDISLNNVPLDQTLVEINGINIIEYSKYNNASYFSNCKGFTNKKEYECYVKSSKSTHQ